MEAQLSIDTWPTSISAFHSGSSPRKSRNKLFVFVFFCNRISTLKIKRIKFPAIPIDIPISKPPKNPSSSGRVAFYLLNSVHKFSDLISIRKKKKNRIFDSVARVSCVCSHLPIPFCRERVALIFPSQKNYYETSRRGRSSFEKNTKKRNRKKWIIWHCRRPNSLTRSFFFLLLPAAKNTTPPTIRFPVFVLTVSTFFFLVCIGAGRDFWVCQMDPWTFWVTQNSQLANNSCDLDFKTPSKVNW